MASTGLGGEGETPYESNIAVASPMPASARILVKSNRRQLDEGFPVEVSARVSCNMVKFQVVACRNITNREEKRGTFLGIIAR